MTNLDEKFLYKLIMQERNEYVNYVRSKSTQELRDLDRQIRNRKFQKSILGISVLGGSVAVEAGVQTHELITHAADKCPIGMVHYALGPIGIIVGLGSAAYSIYECYIISFVNEKLDINSTELDARSS